jgi:DNA-binding CsgD family transcriptional regulator
VQFLVELDRFEEARVTLDTGRRISEEAGVRWHLPNHHAVGGAERFATGEWDDAVAELEASIALSDETGSRYSVVYALGVLSLISFHRGDLTRANQAAAAAAEELSGAGLRFRVQWAMWAQALLLEADGMTADAYATLARCWDQWAKPGLMLESPVLAPDLVRLAVASAEPGRAREVAAAVAEIAGRSGVSSLAGTALRCRGLAEDDPGVLLAAATAYAVGRRPLELALASEDAGAAFARHGHTDRARPLLEPALQIYERLDAARDLARAEAVLRAAGIRRGRRGTRGRPQTGWHSLTPTERTVADLVAGGLSNPRIGDRLFISRRTVQTHLAHVFAKLDITSRAQLAALVIQHQGSQSPEGTGPGG